MNLGLRFLLEIAALVAFGLFGWSLFVVMWLQFLSAVALPVSAMFVWGTFAVPDDQSRSENAPIPIPGVVRLILELSFFGLAAWCLYRIGKANLGLGLGIITLGHYLVSADRVSWLLGRQIEN